MHKATLQEATCPHPEWSPALLRWGPKTKIHKDFILQIVELPSMAGPIDLSIWGGEELLEKKGPVECLGTN